MTCQALLFFDILVVLNKLNDTNVPNQNSNLLSVLSTGEHFLSHPSKYTTNTIIVSPSSQSKKKKC